MPIRPPRKTIEERTIGGSRWCEEHQRAECTKQRSKGRGICHNMAIRGTKACKIHGGKKTEILKAEGEANITAWKVTGQANIDYRMAVLGVLQMTWLRLAAYAELLRQQVVAEGDQVDPDGLEAGGGTRTNGLIGYRYGAAGKDGHIYAQSEAVRALVELEAGERDRVVRFAKIAHDMGISDRLTSLAERWGDVVAGRISAMLAELELSPEQSLKVPTLIQKHLGTIDVDDMAGTKT